MTENKKPLFDEKEFGEAWETMSAERMRIFIRKSIRKAQREAVMEVLEELLKKEHTSIGSDEFFEGVEHSRKIFKAEIDRIRQKFSKMIAEREKSK